MSNSQDTGALERALRKLGFTEPEARTYAALARVQPATAYEVSKASGLPKANCYNAVATLQSWGAVQPVTQDPVRYVLVEPGSFFDDLSSNTRQAANDAIRVTRSLSVQQGTPYVQHLKSQKILDREVTRAINEAKNHVFLKTVDTIASPFIEVFQDASERGVKISIIASGSQWQAFEELPNVHVIPHEGTGSIPSVPHAKLLTMTCDSEKFAVCAFTDRPYGYVARNPALVYVMQTMLLHEIYLAEIYLAIGAQTLADAGCDFETLRARHRPKSTDLQINALNSASI